MKQLLTVNMIVFASNYERKPPSSTTQGRSAANPEKAHIRDAPRISTTNGMPSAMLAHIPSVAQGRTRMP
jgi:hypothetical protein